MMSEDMNCMVCIIFPCAMGIKELFGNSTEALFALRGGKRNGFSLNIDVTALNTHTHTHPFRLCLLP